MRSVLALAALALLAGCTPPPAAPAPSPAPGEGSAGGVSGPLAASLQIRPSADSVVFTFAVTNSTAQPLALEFRSGQSYDFGVSDGGREVWRWSADRTFTQALRTETLGPGETRTWRESWRPAASLRGRDLTATARLVSTSHPVERTQTFRLP
jgi:intracellular proteinase inhibitor BsuPI